MASEKRCHYEVLGLSRECTADEIRAAYKKLALQRHPDKLVKSGLTQAQATAQFQELAQAYEILSDPKERAWYDSHRSQILFSEPNSSNSVPNSLIPNLFSFFSNTVFSGFSDSGRGFYKVYSDLFDKIYANEINFVKRLGLGLGSVREAPVMGNLESPYVQVTAFYNYWLGFCTVMDFCWVDEYDAMAGPNRKSRRMMEEENKKLRKKARRDYNETVRGLAEFVKKRDKRVIDMTVKRNLEMEKKKEEERERKRKMEKEKVERVRAYVEPEWARAKELEEEEEGQRNGGMEEEEEEERKERELYCVICKKKFKSDKQWKNHEQSKKHKEKVAEFRESLVEEEEEEEEVEVEEKEKEMEEEDELAERIGDDLGIGEEENGDDSDGNSGSDDEMGVLEAMLAGHNSKKNVGSRGEDETHDSDDGVEAMEYDNRKSTRRNRRRKKESGKKNGGGEAMRDASATNEIDDRHEESNGHDNSNKEESSSHSFAENENNGNDEEGDKLARKKKTSNQPIDKKGAGKKETDTKSKNSSKGKKAKATSKNSSNLCDTCGEEFESRNKLHMHLGDTGHAKLKYR